MINAVQTLTGLLFDSCFIYSYKNENQHSVSLFLISSSAEQCTSVPAMKMDGELLLPGQSSQLPHVTAGYLHKSAFQFKEHM